jgi:hypothetical protein
MPAAASNHGLRHRCIRAIDIVALLIVGGAIISGQAPPPPTADLIPFQKNAPSDNKLWGYADPTGKLVIPAQFDAAHPFTADGLAEIKRGGHWGMIDRQGREVIPPLTSYQVPSQDGRAGVCVDDGQAIPGLSILGPKPGQRTQVQGTICGYLDTTGALAIPFEYNWIHPFKEGVAPASISKPSTYCPAVDLGRATMYGLLDTKGTVLVPFETCYIGPSENGWSRVVYDSPSSNVQHVGFVDREGHVVLPKMPYDFAAEHWSEDRLPVRSGNRWGFVDRKGNLAVPIRYDDVFGFSDGRARVQLGNKWGFIDPNGQVVVPVTAEYASDFSEQLGCVGSGDRIAFIDPAGKKLFEARFDPNDGCRRRFTEGLRATLQSGKWGYIDRTGKFVIAAKFDEAWGFSEGVAAVRQGESWGFVDHTGAMVIPAKYFRVDQGFVNGLAYVTVRIDNPCCPGLYKASDGYIDHFGHEFFDAP